MLKNGRSNSDRPFRNVGCSYISRDALKSIKKKLKHSDKQKEKRDWKKDQSA